MEWSYGLQFTASEKGDEPFDFIKVGNILIN
jgi:hypothetical protein